MKKNKRLNQLFEEWDEKRDYDHFIRDGIMNENLFERTDQEKILFISKEANRKEDKSDGDFREWWEKEHSGIFSKRIAQWAYGILNDFPPFDAIDYAKERSALQSISFMDVKKFGGGSTSNDSQIIQFVSDDNDFIKRQINIIDPTLIISSIPSYANELIFGNNFLQSGYRVAYKKEGKRIIVDFYHPSGQSGAAMGYVLLEKVLEVIGYRNKAILKN